MTRIAGVEFGVSDCRTLCSIVFGDGVVGDGEGENGDGKWNKEDGRRGR